MSVTAAQGFRASGGTAGLKASGGRDVALVVNDGPDHHVAAVFTSNRVEAAPVTWSRQVVSDGRADAVFLNSGGANACTGPQGFQDTHRTAELVAEAMSCSAMDVVVCSTGLIGEFLPMDKIENGVGLTSASLGPDGGADAARAIMTTDSVHKEATATGDGWTVGGMAKGAGMLAPGLATMLCVIATDAAADAASLDEALRAATAVTFDRVDSDGCMSTNDTVVLMASGASGLTVEVAELTAAVTDVCAALAKQLIDDAEGASHVIAVEVRSAATESDAVDVARSVTRSNLFKAAIFGKDPNWGRVLAAVGTTQAQFDATTLDVAINGVQVCRAATVGDDRDLVDLEPREVHVVIDLHAGDATATVWTNDLTHDYVHENSAYSS
ncbi:bifunctional glutamate N-acetyltransferase/amino-acid acetyltransferase ArgJ [Knoellia sp. S7-12]|uniref:bifunctional glutamate N-acetyltransferase/amino-acid acetyltransferase ArgJ n=1 Tax=Knoellia sp. S7-12 TaxID=3126698 RepID=UPI003367DE90